MSVVVYDVGYDAGMITCNEKKHGHCEAFGCYKKKKKKKTQQKNKK